MEIRAPAPPVSPLEQKPTPPHSLPSDDARYRLLVEAITDYAIYLVDLEGRVSSWNAGAQRFKGYAASEIIGSHFSRFYTEEDRRARLPEKALATAAREGRFESEGWRVRKDGTRFWAHVVINAILDTSGRLAGFAKITRDLSERRETAETLRRSEEQFRLLVQAVTDYAIYMLDTEGRVASWNPGAQRIKGYTPDEIIGAHFSRFYTPEDRARGEPARALETARRNGSFEKEGWRVRKDGSRFWASVVVDPVRDKNGQIIGFAKITRDISERRNAQIALDQARDALMQSQKMEAVGQLTGGIAHDFNNLLMAVLSSLELVRKRLPQDPRILSLIDNAVHGAERGAALTQRMLAFARRQDLKLGTVDVPVLVRGMTDLLQRSLGPSVQIETRFPLALSHVRADANQFELALLNLGLNARDAMPDGGPLIFAAREQDVAAGNAMGLAAGRYVCLSTIDSGSGMDEATLARAAEPFFTTKGVGKGTGLGLSMVHGLAEQSGGCLVLKSRPNEGTTAEIWLTVADDIGAERPPAPAPAARNAQVEPELVILAVDDDDLVLSNTVAMLEELGHRPLAAMSAAEALAILRTAPHVDLVMTDQAMPGMTGVELASAIKAEWPAIPVVIATGFAELSGTAGIQFTKLAKPFKLDDLARVVVESVGH
jgi:PAS domain S-box-containing protein